MTTDSLKKRYAAKLGSQALTMAANVVSQSLVARALGPAAFGSFNFIQNFFSEVKGFLDMGTSVGFYTKLSQRPNEFGIIAFYARFLLLVSALIFAAVLGGQLLGFLPSLFPGQETLFVYAGALWGILYFVREIVSKILDAKGLTVISEKLNVSWAIIGVTVLASMFGANILSLGSYFLYQFGMFLYLSLVGLVILDRRGGGFWRRPWKLPQSELRSYSLEFIEYSGPLFISALAGMCASILDRWMLQKFSGSAEQGFYGLAYNVGRLAFLFTSAMQPLLMREFSIAAGERDKQRLAHLFRRYVPLLYSIAAYFSCFMAVEAKTIVAMVGGNAYENAILPLTIMLFYPLHQTYGQLTSSVFMATGNTRQYRNLSFVALAFGTVATWFALAPLSWFGLNAGALGLAVKMVVVQVVMVNVQLWYNCRELGTGFFFFVAHQAACAAWLLVCGFAAKCLADLCIGQEFAAFFLAGVVYTVLIGVSALVVPALFGLDNKDRERALALVRRR